MYIETDPELLSDPLFAELDRIIQLLEESPQILREKNPNFEHGLNMSQVNTMTQHAGLGSSPVFGVEIKKDGSLLTERWLNVYHPLRSDPLRVQTWSRYSVPDWKANLPRMKAYLAAWRDAQKRQVQPQRTERPATGKRRRLKEPPKHYFTIYRLSIALGSSQLALAEIISRELKQTISQSTVSRAIIRVKEWREAGNVLPVLQPHSQPTITPTDPTVLESGRRIDHRSRGQQAKMQQAAKEKK